MTLGDDFGDFANGLPLLGAFASALPAAKLSGNKLKAVQMVKYSDDTLEKVPSVIKKTVREDSTINYANDKEIHNSLKSVANDTQAREIIEKYRGEYGKEISDIDKELLQTTLNNRVTDKKLEIVDVVKVSQDEDGVMSSTVLLGNGWDGQAAMTKKGVDNLAKELGITEYTAVKKDGAGYYLQTTIESSIKDLDTSDFGTLGFGRIFYGSTNMPQWFHEELIANYRKATKMEKTLFDNYGKSLRKLSGKQKTVSQSFI